MYPGDMQQTIPLLEEQLVVAKQTIISDQLSVTTHVEERDVLIEETVERGNLRIERVAVERAVAEAPAPRQDGDTLILAVVEERVVVEKRLYVIEEIRITRVSITERVAIPETVRTMHATIAHADTASLTGSKTDG